MRYIILLVVLTSCGAGYHLRKAEKHIQKALAKGATIKLDTLFKTVPVKVPGIKADFGPTIVHEGSTVVLTKDSIITRIKRMKGDTMFVESECPPRVVYQKVPYTVTQTIKANSGLPWWVIPLCLCIGFVSACGLLLLRRGV